MELSTKQKNTKNITICGEPLQGTATHVLHQKGLKCVAADPGARSIRPEMDPRCSHARR